MTDGESVVTDILVEWHCESRRMDSGRGHEHNLRLVPACDGAAHAVGCYGIAVVAGEDGMSSRSAKRRNLGGNDPV